MVLSLAGNIQRSIEAMVLLHAGCAVNNCLKRSIHIDEDDDDDVNVLAFRFVIY